MSADAIPHQNHAVDPGFVYLPGGVFGNILNGIKRCLCLKKRQLDHYGFAGPWKMRHDPFPIGSAAHQSVQHNQRHSMPLLFQGIILQCNKVNL